MGGCERSGVSRVSGVECPYVMPECPSDGGGGSPFPGLLRAQAFWWRVQWAEELLVRTMAAGLKPLLWNQEPGEAARRRRDQRDDSGELCWCVVMMFLVQAEGSLDVSRYSERRAPQDLTKKP